MGCGLVDHLGRIDKLRRVHLECTITGGRLFATQSRRRVAIADQPGGGGRGVVLQLRQALLQVDYQAVLQLAPGGPAGGLEEVGRLAGGGGGGRLRQPPRDEEERVRP